MLRRLPLALALVACSPAGPSDEDDPSDPDGQVDEPLAPLNPRPSSNQCRLEGTAADALPRFTTAIVEGASFPAAVQLLASPTAGIWIVESSGRIWALDPSAAAPPTLVVDLGDRVDCCGSRGLLAAAVGPGPALFVHYHRADAPERTRVGRLSLDPSLASADPATEVTVIEVEHDGVAASGGALLFDAAGMLLVGIGDDSASAPSDPNSSPARDRLDLRGSVLRLDVSADGPGYAIPSDNPYVDDPTARPELYAFGLHDPRTCVADLDGRIWCADSGNGVREEFDALIAGADFGWPVVEGFRCVLGECEPSSYAAPHFDYGLVDPDADLPHCRALAGYGREDLQLFGDRCSGRVFGLRTDVGPGAVEIVGAVPAGIAALGPDANGEPWLVDGDGRLARLVVPADGVPGTLPTRLSETGCFVDTPARTPAPELVPFLVAAPLWSDGLLKRRYMVVPPDQQIRVQTDGRWSFPDRSVLIKTFELEPEPGQPSSRRPIETRFMVRRNGAWEFHSYRWQDDGGDATLLDGEAHATLTVAEPDGPHEFDWLFPDAIGCRTCHGFAGGRPLGPVTAQLHREVRYGEGPAESQLDALLELGLLAFDQPPSDLAELPALVDPRDLDAPLAARARSYFEANCAHCHQPAWMRPDLRAATPLAETGLCDAIEFPSPWVAGEQRIVPGEPEQSNLWLRMGVVGEGQMPPLGVSTIDPLGHALIAEWITELESCE